MTIYVFNALTALILSVIYSKKIKVTHGLSISGKKIYLIVIFLIFTSIMALRALSVGVDTAPYSRIYKIIGTSDSLDNALARAPTSAPVYVTICWLLYHISPDPQLLTFVSSIFITIGLFKFINKASDDVVISCNSWIGLTMLYASMNGHRQFMSLVLMLNAIYFLSQTIKSPKGWILVFLAVGIHSSSLFSLIALIGVFLEKKIKSKKTIFIISVFLGIGLSFGFQIILPIAISFVPRYSMYVDGTSPFNILEGSGSGRIIFLYIFLLTITILYIAKDKKNNETDFFNNKIFSAVVFGCVFGIFNACNELINRMLWFYIAIFITFIPATSKKFQGIPRRVISYGAVIALYIYSFISLNENQNGIVPYMFFWD